MGKLKAIGSNLSKLKPTLGSLPPVERTASAERQLFSPWRTWYKSARWRALRLLVFARDLYTCQWRGCGFTTANTSLLVADHRKPHRGDEGLFWDFDNLQTLCKPCHDRHKQRVERAGS
ncbi:MAG: HNH endonuclease signature motif containing protein [Sphingomonas phyllosphaerae]